MGRLTTHILDTERGRPAAGVKIELFSVAETPPRKLAETTTNSDGRTDRPMLEGAAMLAGSYELHFHIGSYFAASGRANTRPGFLDIVVIRFGLGPASGPDGTVDEHFHVPLLVQQHGYSTYRGS